MPRLPVPKLGERVSIFGASGSGKTELAKRLLLTQKNVIIVDTKLNEDWSGIGRSVSGNEVYKVRLGRYTWHVPESFISGNTDVAEQDRFFRWVYKNKNRVVYVDELSDVAPNANSYADGLKIVATRGRSAGIGLWTTTQRPAAIPLFALSEAVHTFIFELPLKKDRERIAEMVQAQIDWQKIAGNHKFYYINKHRQVFGPYIIDINDGY